MRLPRQATFCFLSALICVNLLVRYPLLSHEIGIDTFIFHGMATDLAALGHAKWTLHPLSYLGLYPLSQPSGSPFFVVAFSGISSVSIEGSILLMDLTIAPIAILVAFLLGWEFARNEVFALLLAAVLSFTPTLLTALVWQMPTRIMFTILLPLFIWSMIRLAREPRRQHAFISIATFLVMMSFHRLTVFVSLVAIAYVLTGILLVGLHTLRLRRPEFFLRKGISRLSPYLTMLAFLSVAAGVLFLTNVLDQYSVGVFNSGDTLEVQLVNLSVSVARGSGLLLPLSVIGIVGIAFQRNKSVKEPFVLIGYLVFVPMLFLRQYTSYYTVPYTSLFIAYGLYFVLRRLRSARARIAVVSGAMAFLMVSSLAIAAYDFRF